ncbi:hypothetical protein JJQ51_01060 [Rhizobium sp. AG207R]|uniref:hypothetical protein n=1 Tax=Rhizobium sp. TaxID=391 RepID=UPI0011A86346|nr:MULTISPECIES: hypothetical protein [Rhizobium]MCZ3374503.1 hypothetical protein [Rhizobium sp. AG207R]
MAGPRSKNSRCRFQCGTEPSNFSGLILDFRDSSAAFSLISLGRAAVHGSLRHLEALDPPFGLTIVPRTFLQSIDLPSMTICQQAARPYAKAAISIDEITWLVSDRERDLKHAHREAAGVHLSLPIDGPKTF